MVENNEEPTCFQNDLITASPFFLTCDPHSFEIDDLRLHDITRKLVYAQDP